MRCLLQGALGVGDRDQTGEKQPPLKDILELLLTEFWMLGYLSYNTPHVTPRPIKLLYNAWLLSKPPWPACWVILWIHNSHSNISMRFRGQVSQQKGRDNNHMPAGIFFWTLILHRVLDQGQATHGIVGNSQREGFVFHSPLKGREGERFPSVQSNPCRTFSAETRALGSAAAAEY